MFQFLVFHRVIAKSNEAVIKSLCLSESEAHFADLQIHRLSSTAKVEQDTSAFTALVFNPYKGWNI